MIKIRSSEELFLESVYGNLVTAYHRTKRAASYLIFKDGFKLGIRTKYGKGIYSTYELDSQLNDRMRIDYGDVILKLIFPIENFVIFDYDEFNKAPLKNKLLRKDYNVDKENFIFSQLDFFGMIYDKELLKQFTDKEYSSLIAEWCYNNIVGFERFCEGIIFTGRRDGHVLVCYNLDLVYIVSMTTDEGKTWLKDEIDKESLKSLIFRKTNSFNPNPKDKPEDFGIVDYHYDDKGRLIIDQDVDLSNRNLDEIPLNIYEIFGSFDISNNSIKDLKGCPDLIRGNFNFSYNNIIYYIDAPKIVYGNVICLGKSNKIFKTTIEKETDVRGSILSDY